MDREVFQEQFGLLGTSQEMRHVIDKIMQVAKTDISVLLQGESGVGKDVTARAIHSLSERKRNNLIIVNCGAIPEGIIESELFGHEKGAFTGANESREGYFEKANGGTIFLDEIGDTPKNVQVKLLRVLENGEFFRVGSSKVQTTDVRVIAATNLNLWKLVQDGSFREDLYYRLDTVQIHLPALRERQEDVVPIFRKFVQEFSAKYDSVFKGFSDEARELLISYRWPGNIRELKNVAEQLVVLEKSQFIDVERLQKYLKGRQRQGSADNLPMIPNGEEKKSDSGNDFERRDRELVYRALVELRTDISDVKKMLANFMYSAMSSKDIKALPPALQSNMDESDVSEMKINLNEHATLGMQKMPGEDTEDENEVQESEQSVLVNFFGGDEIPSIEATEQFLIKQALDKYDGNRRKASETLGISERTLYRKLDQYGLA
ncbi:MAG: sigma-54-dependent Fis family transcriptional regulator [Balneola sp.]|nr:sigma-54-dependent Fis family transcriptional regulator [Balneola sp.]MBO6649434.1 sigma-54-dependent Fis family transcriptional regulator [Balneola sp.]MBO6711249.1 sigma-54-dependent Fis family transcriptional regulator [Balneola sp.]MBO6800636.1 sigma-54-dependent Fis family transcriptional regulator [Balneola sp.]MBO6869184.1 sigma-54-dependent Fis family transcriptional regulator [Balneola sp.]